MFLDAKITVLLTSKAWPPSTLPDEKLLEYLHFEEAHAFFRITRILVQLSYGSRQWPNFGTIWRLWLGFFRSYISIVRLFALFHRFLLILNRIIHQIHQICLVYLFPVKFLFFCLMFLNFLVGGIIHCKSRDKYWKQLQTPTTLLSTVHQLVWS